jgi:hypothetical protein
MTMHGVGLLAGPLWRRLVSYAAIGTAGDLVVKGASRAGPRVAPVARRAAVGGLAQGIVVGRWLGEVAEEARLRASDMLAEAHASLGEEAPVPGPHVEAAHDHDHDH